MGLKRRVQTQTAVAVGAQATITQEGPAKPETTGEDMVLTFMDEPTEAPQTPLDLPKVQTDAETPEEPTEGKRDRVERAMDRYNRPPNWGYIGRKDCLAFTEAKNSDGEPIEGPRGPVYNCRQVPPKKGHLYCTECHDYTVFKSAGDEKVCTQCGISTNDAYVKTANGLWPTMKK